MKKLGISNYEIIEKNRKHPDELLSFWKKKKTRSQHRTAGGWTKASTGYTFKNSDKKSTQLTAFLRQDLRKFQKRPNSGFMTCCF
jgi:lycopene beta-cyclase